MFNTPREPIDTIIEFLEEGCGEVPFCKKGPPHIFILLFIHLFILLFLLPSSLFSLSLSFSGRLTSGGKRFNEFPQVMAMGGEGGHGAVYCNYLQDGR
jgi:hypothetical protein